ncbi:MAG: helix-turn-helix domain-containing protein [Candidatus Binatia bacterium]
MARAKSPLKTRDEVSTLLRLSLRGIDVVLKKAGVPTYKIGRKTLYHEDDLRQYLQAQRNAGEDK